MIEEKNSLRLSIQCCLTLLVAICCFQTCAPPSD